MVSGARRAPIRRLVSFDVGLLILALAGAVSTFGCGGDGTSGGGDHPDGAATLDAGDTGSAQDGASADAGDGDDDGGVDGDGEGGAAGRVQLGFNAKGTLDTDAQVALARVMLDAMPAATRSRLHVRVSGGTRSQTERSSDWSDAALDAWIGLQADEGFGMVFVVNGNDTPQAQAAFVQRWLARGAWFSFLELMNEYYLPKYRDGDTSKPEVTKVVTAESYTTDILPEYLSALSGFGLPTFVICAPEKNADTAAWNDVILDAVNAHAEWHAGVTLHLYDDGAGTFDYAQIDALRGRLPAGTSIAITESGVTDPAVTTYAEAAPRFFAHDSAVLAHLAPGDYLFDQILYSNYPDDVTATLHPSYVGLTPKGTAVVELFESTP